MTLEELGQIAEEKRSNYERLGSQNVYGLSVEKRVALDIEYRMAQTEFNQAMLNYYNALQYHAAQNRTGGFNDARRTETNQRQPVSRRDDPQGQVA